MVRGASTPSSAGASSARKAMRKGTHSCTECRRRKIRCNLMSGSSVCFNCESRGTACVSQNGGAAPMQIRRRHSVVESRAAEDETQSTARKSHAGLQDVDVLDNSTTDRRAPFISVMERSGLSGLADRTNASPANHKRTSEALRAEMPPYDTIMQVALKRADWWVRVQRAARGTSSKAVESFPDFVQRNYTSDRPSEVAQIAIAYAFAADEDASHLYALVSRLVISDMSYVSTVEGLDCLILLGILYADEGQPRRSWMIWRRGVVIAQLTDLYQTCLRDKSKRRIWLSIYRGDRMMSMFLGLPYGFNDLHCQELLEQKSESEYDYWDSTLGIGVGIISGKLLDRNLSRTKDRFSCTLQLDEELNQLAASYPSSWWQVPAQSLDGADDDEEKVWAQMHSQMFFFHLRLYIYLPFFSGPVDSGHGLIARRGGIDAARELLKRYLGLGGRVEGESPSECKLVDFMAFTAAIVLLLGSSDASHPKPSDARGDIEAVSSLVQHLQTLESRDNDMIASQCRKTLAVLLTSRNEGEEVRIPFFGTVSRRGTHTSEMALNEVTNTGTHTLQIEAEAILGGNATPSTTESDTAYITPISNEPPAGADLELPSDTYLQATSMVQHWHDMPELDFLYHLEDTSMDFDSGWEFLMDVDSF
ncbi:hypothetical protein B0I35DRAFT_435552 [Stachybotrys elegans]|uniref:Zn(2)-C6 fungal-type domain-containing protein n=1 Tax=Stachybotrys elegans TaxID=80388 RepID=A0A8K0STD0_9HYPO|nr:hypothetical protein B0I35DRAFT_435552 [Stachybotrys elegans]